MTATATAARAVRRRVDHVMGLPVSLALRGEQADGDAADRAWDAVMSSLREADRVFSTYREDSVVSRLDRGELALADCPPEVAEVLAIGEVARRDTGGAFDVHRCGFDGCRRLDPSGVVKGWAVQRAAETLRSLRRTDFCLSAGGDMVCHVADLDAPSWQVGVEDPSDPSRVLARIPVRHGAVATSGFAHRGAHVVDARSGRAPEGVTQVTVVAADLTTADVDATAALALGPDALPWLRSRGRTGLVVLADGTAHVLGG
ncbi:FAD:protein FMN transferase [Angustibacter peucedani]